VPKCELGPPSITGSRWPSRRFHKQLLPKALELRQITELQA
jgi:hypothetical protein